MAAFQDANKLLRSERLGDNNLLIMFSLQYAAQHTILQDSK